MKKRILPFAMATKLDHSEASAVSASGSGFRTGGGSVQMTFTINCGHDVIIDGNVDLSE